MATRFYFSNTANSSGLTPAYDAGWGYTTEASRYDLAKTKDAADTVVTGTQIGPWTANTTTRALDRQYISEPLAAGVTISGTFTGWLRVREYNNGDNVDRICVKIYVVTSAGATRGTLVAINNGAVATTEFVNNANLAARQFGSATAVTSVTASAGDRIVVEIGYRCNTAPSTPEAAGAWGQSEADITANGDTVGSGWIEFSTDLPFPVEVSNALLSLYETEQSLSGTLATRFESAGPVSQSYTSAYEFITFITGLNQQYEALQELIRSHSTPYESQQEQITGDPVDRSAQTPMEIIGAASSELAFEFENTQPVTTSRQSLYETRQEVAKLLAKLYETQQPTSSQAGTRYESIQPLATLLAVWFESRQPMSSDATARMEMIQPLAALSSSLYEVLSSRLVEGSALYESIQPLAVFAAALMESVATAARSGDGSYESAQPLTASLQSRFEGLASTSGQASGAYEWLREASQNGQVNYESGGDTVAQTYTAVYESLLGAASTQAQEFEVIASALASVTKLTESLRLASAESPTQYDFVREVALELPVAFESVLALTTAATATHSMEAVASLIALMQSAQENLQAASRSMQAPHLALQGAEASAETPYESEAEALAVNRSASIPYESFGVLIQQCVSSIEAVAPLLNTARVVTESQATLNSSAAKNIESFGQVARALSTSYDTLVNIATEHSGATESLRAELSVSSAPFELVRNLLASGASNAESIGSVGSSVTVSLESIQAILAQYEAAYNAVLLLLASGRTPFETKPNEFVKTFFFEQLAAIASTLADTIATLRAVVGDVSTTSAVNLDSVASLPVVVDQVHTGSSMTFDSIEVEVVDSDELEIG